MGCGESLSNLTNIFLSNCFIGRDAMVCLFFGIHQLSVKFLLEPVEAQSVSHGNYSKLAL